MSAGKLFQERATSGLEGAKRRMETMRAVLSKVMR